MKKTICVICPPVMKNLASSLLLGQLHIEANTEINVRFECPLGIEMVLNE